MEIGNSGLTPVPPGVTPIPIGSVPYTIRSTAIASTLNDGGDVTISTVQPGSDMPGDITVTSPLTWNGAGSLRLEAERDINIAANIGVGDGDFTAVAARDIRNGGNISAPRDGGVTLDAGRSVLVNQNIRATGGGGVAMLAGSGSVLLTELRAGNLIVSTDTGPLTMRARDGSVELRRVNPAAGSNIQVYSNSGPVDLSAGDRILLQGGVQGGRWVRLGQVGSSSAVTLTAPEVKLQGGSVGNTFAEIVSGPGGSITVQASERIWVRNGGGDQARIQTTGGSPLTLLGETQLWDGPVRAGNGANNGGEVVIAGAVTASFQPQFSLAPNAGFTFRPAAPEGTPSSYDSTQPFVVTTSAAGAIEIDAPVSAQQITLESEERVGLGPRGLLTGQAGGDALVVAAGRRFRNDAEAGAAALGVANPDARWLLYLDAFAGLTGPAPAPREFDLYGRSYDAVPPNLLGFDGNRIVYAERPTLTVTAETLTKTYGTVATPGFTLTGLRPGDSLDTAVASGPSVSSAGAPADADVGVYATIAAAEASDQGYRLTLADGTLTVDPAQLTVTADDQRRTYGAPNPPLTAGITGFVLGQDVTDLDGTLTVATAATEASNVGAYDITASGLSSGNYAISYVDGSLTIDPAQLTVAANDQRRTYGAANPALTAGITGFVLGQDVTDLDGSLTVATAATPASDVGAYGITASGLTSSNYAISYVDGTLTVDPAQLVVRPSGTRTYGSLDTDFDPEVTGFVLGQDLADLGGALIYETLATIDSGVGDYLLTASGLSSSNYAISYVDGSLTIDPAQLTVIADDQRRTYGAANPALTAGITGFVLGQDLSDLDGTLVVATAATPASDAGAYDITASGLASGNYAISYVDGSLTIDPAQLTVTANDQRRTYGAANPALTAGITGFVLGQDVSDLDGALIVDTAATPASDVGAYDIAASGLASGNYAISYVDGTLTIDPAQLTITANDQRRTYGAANPALTAGITGFVLGQDVADLDGTLTVATAATAASDVGAYDITASGLSSGNYAIAYVDGALTIDPAQLVVRPSGTRTYGSLDTDFDPEVTGFVLGQDLSDLGGALTYLTEATVDSDVGDYLLTASGLTSSNYAIDYAEGTLTIDPAQLTVAADDQRRSYGAANPTLTAGITGFVLGQDVSDLDGALTLATVASPTSDVGAYDITASGLASGNYAIAYVDGALTVDPARLTVAANDQRRTYGAANPALTAGITGFVLGQDVSDLDGALTLATAATAASGVGAYDITASGLSSGNYAISYVDGALTVDPARLVVTANDAERPEGQPNPAFTARYDGFVLGQDAGVLGGILVLDAEAGPNSPPGDYAITAGGLSSANYAIVYENGLLTVQAVTPPGPTVGPRLASLDQSIETVGRGAPPFTPGDSAFRTTNAEAPTSIDSTFTLTYSLGEIAQLAPPEAADTDGFTPASGGGGGAAPAATACSGPIAPATPQEACVLRSAPELFWTTAFPEGGL